MTGANVSEPVASVLGCLLTSALIYGGTGVIDHTNDRPLSVRLDGGGEHGHR